MKLSATFTRKSPAEFAQKIGLPVGWFVLPHRLIESMAERRRLHGKWCKLKSENGTAYRVIRFSPRLKGTNRGDGADIVLDWLAWIDLNDRDENVESPLRISIAEARWYEYPWLAVSHPEPSYRLASWIALVSLMLGGISVALGIWSVWLTYR